ncbi:MAG: glycosyltransferase family 2 protein [Prevotella sp.]|nr:glycosyltransferase family 2 protein [Prevotella sp.]
MTVTIIVPVYGVEKYIVECVESLFAQTYSGIEYVFCDDCTPDRSIELLREVVERYPERKERVRIVHNDTNMGIGTTRKRLVSEVHTDTFLFVDSDDVLPLNAVETLVKRMKETDTDIVDGAYAIYVDEKVGKVITPPHDEPSKYLDKILCQNIILPRVWGRLYKTSVLDKVKDLFIEGIDFAEDICATSRLACVTSRSWTDEVVYYYRTDNINSYTRNITKRNILSYFRAMSVVLSFYHQRKGHLPMSLEIGVLNAYRQCGRSDIPVTTADEIIAYVPEHFSARLLYWLFHSKSVLVLKLADYLYRLIRISN